MMNRKLKMTAAVIVAVCVGAAIVPGCRPVTSHDSIYADADQPPDPAVADPYIGVGGPGSVESVIQQPPPATQSALPRLPTQRTWQSVDVPADQAVRIWIDGRPARQPIDGKTFAVDQAVSRRPVLRFEIDARLGRFRGAAVLVRRVTKATDADSGVRLSEDGEPAALLPGVDISLCSPPKGVERQFIGVGDTAKFDELAEDAEYEVQVLVSGSATSDSAAARFRTAARPLIPATQPADQPPPPDNRVDPTRLPPGVEIPKN